MLFKNTTMKEKDSEQNDLEKGDVVDATVVGNNAEPTLEAKTGDEAVDNQVINLKTITINGSLGRDITGILNKLYKIKEEVVAEKSVKISSESNVKNNKFLSVIDDASSRKDVLDSIGELVKAKESGDYDSFGVVANLKDGMVPYTMYSLEEFCKKENIKVIVGEIGLENFLVG